ncbi:MAG: 16S rRNA (guanine(966)-N(2))-methyltransferase RsmD [Bacteroidales bacterium]
MRIIRGKYGRRRFSVPTNITARPTTDFAKENMFNILENWFDFEGMSMLDLFAGTGSIGFEFLSRGCDRVVAVEMSSTQYNFIRKVKGELKDDNYTPIKGDVFKFISAAKVGFDIIFVDPPYDLPRFAEIPELILNSKLVKNGTLLIVEHSKKHNFSELPHFTEHREYGSVNFSFFEVEGL